MINVPDHVENEQKYIAGAMARIRANTRKGWLQRDPSRAQLEEALQVEAMKHPDGFFAKMFDTIQKYGKLSDKQEAAVRNSIAKREAKKAEFNAERAANSSHFGNVGDRQQFELTCVFETSFESQFGTQFVLILKNEAGNTFVYKGSAPFCQKGEKVRLTATIKAHNDRNGEKQTILARPSKVEITKGEAAE